MILKSNYQQSHNWLGGQACVLSHLNFRVQPLV